jgi:hypothetical protein
MVSVNDGHSYVPSNIGHEIIYDVDSIVKSDFNGMIDTVHYQVREVIESISTDNERRPTLRLERYKRLTPSDPWVIYKVWTANVTNVNYEKKEDNITYIKLIFPLVLNKKWNGNAKNDLEEEDYEYVSVNTPENFNSIILDSALTVVQSDFDDFYVEKVIKSEKYATGIGMFYKEYFVGNYKYPSDSLDPFDKFVNYKEKMVSYKN